IAFWVTVGSNPPLMIRSTLSINAEREDFSRNPTTHLNTTTVKTLNQFPPFEYLFFNPQALVTNSYDATSALRRCFDHFSNVFLHQLIGLTIDLLATLPSRP
ncbi:hypothetical protein AVEN_30327-1, partial [Araneus ventricosus]